MSQMMYHYIKILCKYFGTSGTACCNTVHELQLIECMYVSVMMLSIGLFLTYHLSKLQFMGENVCSETSIILIKVDLINNQRY